MNPKIAILFGSDSDFPFFLKAIDFLKQHRIPFAIEVTSAHRSPQRTLNLIKELENQGIRVIIAAAGGAAHLPGVVAAHTLLPVLGVPISSTLLGLDSLLSMSQMPKGVPVATFGIGEAGAFNAVLFGLQILAGDDAKMEKMLKQFRRQQGEDVQKKSRTLKEQLQKE